MIIQSRKVWFADQFVEAQIEVANGKIVNIYNYYQLLNLNYQVSFLW